MKLILYLRLSVSSGSYSRVSAQLHPRNNPLGTQQCLKPSTSVGLMAATPGPPNGLSAHAGAT